MGKLTVAEARQVDMVDYLSSLGYQAIKVRGEDFWYLSPFRNERTASFKINRRSNIWYDHGSGEGGNIIDFGILYHKVDVTGLLELLARDFLRNNLSFHPPAQKQNISSYVEEKTTTAGNKIIITDSRPISAPMLMHYLESRAIPVDLAQQVCMEVDFQLYKKQHTAIGFPNDAGGYELRNAYFKGSSSPKTFRNIRNGSGELEVFEGMFDFLSWLSFNAKQMQPGNFLILNSLSFFQKARPLMEGHTKINLWLDRGPAGEACTKAALKTPDYEDKSNLYKGFDDLNDWWVQQVKQKQSLDTSSKQQHSNKLKR